MKTVNGVRYGGTLNEYFILLVESKHLVELFFQQDGATLYTIRCNMEVLSRVTPDIRLVSKYLAIKPVFQVFGYLVGYSDIK